MTDPTTNLLTLSRDLLARSTGSTLWRRAAATLTRQALEQTLHHLWQRRAPGLEQASMKAQLACLPEFLPGTDLAPRTALAWGELSAACHAHDYGLVIDHASVERSLDTIGELGEHPALGAPTAKPSQDTAP